MFFKKKTPSPPPIEKKQILLFTEIDSEIYLVLLVDEKSYHPFQDRSNEVLNADACYGLQLFFDRFFRLPFPELFDGEFVHGYSYEEPVKKGLTEAPKLAFTQVGSCVDNQTLYRIVEMKLPEEVRLDDLHNKIFEFLKIYDFDMDMKYKLLDPIPDRTCSVGAIHALKLADFRLVRTADRKEKITNDIVTLNNGIFPPICYLANKIGAKIIEVDQKNNNSPSNNRSPKLSFLFDLTDALGITKTPCSDGKPNKQANLP